MPSDLPSKLRSFVSREAVSNAFRRLRGAEGGLSGQDAVVWTTLLAIAVVAFVIRIQPINWGVYLYEFDPYLQYRVTQFILDNGFPAWFTWHDTQVWYRAPALPNGRDMALTTYPGLPLTAAAMYVVARLFGIPVRLWDLACFFPPILGAFACFLIYFLGKDIGGRQVGLFSALFFAVGPAWISRTFLGWFDDETVGIPALLLIFLFYLRSLEPEKPQWRSVGYAAAAGLSLGYLAASWGSSRYAIGLLALLTVALLFLRFSRRLTTSYAVTMGIGLFTAILVPREGLSFAWEITFLAAVGVLALLLIREFTGVFESKRTRILLGALLFATVSVTGLALLQTGAAFSLPVKFRSVLEPLFRIQFPIIESVGEHRPATWGSFYNSFGFLVFLAPLFLYFAAQQPNERNIFLAAFLLTALYFAASFVRLELLAAPAVSLAAAYVLARILDQFVPTLRDRSASARRRLRSEQRLDPLFAVAFMVIIFALTVIPLTANGIRAAQTPASIASAGIPVRMSYPDWLQALDWLRDNAPADAVVASWWDYGYWITVVGNKTTLADNGTLDTKQIATIGLIFLSNETESLKILRRYNVSYIVVFVDFRYTGQGNYFLPGGYGEENKFIWMLRIAANEFPDLGLNESDYLSYDANGQYQGPTEKFEESVIGKLIPYKFVGVYNSQAYYYGPEYYSSEHLSLAFASNTIAKGPSQGWGGGVLIYKVTY
ncbi:MAG: STT3 domain-containing protein [Candidatus Bathyarchaeia archaeon]